MRARYIAAVLETEDGRHLVKLACGHEFYVPGLLVASYRATADSGGRVTCTVCPGKDPTAGAGSSPSSEVAKPAPRPPRRMTYQPTHAEREDALECAKARVALNDRERRPEHASGPSYDRVGNTALGCRGEQILARHLGVPWACNNGERTASDVAGYSVRTVRHRQDTRWAVPPKPEDGTLVCVEERGDGAMELVGWIPIAEGLRDGELDQWAGSGTWDIHVRAANLRPMADLPETEELRMVRAARAGAVGAPQGPGPRPPLPEGGTT